MYIHCLPSSDGFGVLDGRVVGRVGVDYLLELRSSLLKAKSNLADFQQIFRGFLLFDIFGYKIILL